MKADAEAKAEKPLPAVGAGVSRVHKRTVGLPKIPAKTGESESQIQQSLMDWWRLAHKGLGVPHEGLLMAFPLQGKRTPRNGARMKAEGLRAGTPDLLLAVSTPKDSGLWIELKKPGGKASTEQKSMLYILAGQGYEAQICVGFDEARAAIEIYLKNQ